MYSTIGLRPSPATLASLLAAHELGVDQGAASGVLVSHEVAVGVPCLHGGFVAEQGLQDFDRLATADLN
jgi:hypothetical protein